MSDREHEAARAALAENQTQMAYLTGKMEATIDNLRHDPELVAEVARVAKRRGIDPGALMDETIEAARAKHLPAASSGPIQDDGPLDPAVKRFREMLS